MASSMLDDDAQAAFDDGRAAAGVMLRALQRQLQKVFIVFVIGLLGTIYALRIFVWDILREVTIAGMDLETSSQVTVIAQTPFDVILLQAKIGIVVGLLMALPFLLYYSRDGLKARDMWPGVPVSPLKLAALGVTATLLFTGGVAYAYYVFFPVMFNFLASNALGAGFEPNYGIVEWTEFILLLTFSFGLAAQLPLLMSGLAYTDIVTYETFRDKWRHAVVAIFVFGALFSPPDPFTQIMWAVPLLILYGLSLGLTKLVVTAKQSSERVGVKNTIRARWNVIAATTLLVGTAVYSVFAAGGIALVNQHVLPVVPAAYRPGAFRTLAELTGLTPTTVAIAGAVLFGLLTAGATAVYLTYRELVVNEDAYVFPHTTDLGSPDRLDLATLNAAGVRAAPYELFRDLSEDAVLEYARAAMDDGDDEKARAIFARYDAAQETKEQLEDDEPEERSFNERTASAVSVFTEDETTEDDIGGYYYDIAFILESLTSKTFRLMTVFLVVLAGTFFWLNQGGIGDIKDDFLSRIPDVVIPPEGISIVALHPVEALLFEVKMSVIVGAAAVTPLLVYYAWPALRERGLVRVPQRFVIYWTSMYVGGFFAGLLLGYYVIAPGLISFLVFDAIRADMIISYRINNFFWLIFLTTVGVGIWVEVPVTMWFLHHTALLPYKTMRARWREAVILILTVSMFLTPETLLTMLIVAVPTLIAYFFGLGVLWVVTAGGRRDPSIETASE